MNTCKSLVLISCFTFGLVHGANILGIFPSPSISHQIVFRPLMKALAERGHDILVITADPIQVQSNLTSKYKQIDIHDVAYHSLIDVGNILMKEISTLEVIKIFNEITIKLTEAQFSSPQFQNLIKGPKRSFDLCVIENWMTSMYAFKDHFNCSLIIMSSMVGSFSNHDAFSNPTNPILYPDNNAPYIGNMNFWQRLYTVWLILYWRYVHYIDHIAANNRIAKKYFGPNTRDVNEIENDADMMFINGHPLITGIRPTVPSIVYMHSMHINPPKKLPKELESIMNSSISGIIYFSLGSNIKASKLTMKSIEIFLEAFEELPYTVIWKLEEDILPRKPKNVHTMKWFPQQDILAHPKMKLFITQAGLQSLEEAIHFCVPLIGIPFYGDQFKNSHTITKYNLGIELDRFKITKDIIKDAIIKIVQNPIYRQNIKRLLTQIKDEPMKSIERAIWWTEYVLRHKGAGHLKSDAKQYSFYQYFLLDILAFILLCLILFTSMIIFLIKLLYSSLISNRTIKSKTS